MEANLDFSWLDNDIARFKGKGTLIPKGQVELYRKIGNHWTRGRTAIDLGCSIGYGSNLLSHEARHVWGVDVHPEAISFAKHVFERPNLTFEVLDLEKPPERPLSPFEVVVMMEVIEHLPNFEAGLASFKRFFSDRLNTIGFITVPNLGNSRVEKADKLNKLHVNHWAPGEFYELLIKHFKFVTLFSSAKLENWTQDETMDDGDGRSLILIAKVEGINV